MKSIHGVGHLFLNTWPLIVFCFFFLSYVDAVYMQFDTLGPCWTFHVLFNQCQCRVMNFADAESVRISFVQQCWYAKGLLRVWTPPKCSLLVPFLFCISLSHPCIVLYCWFWLRLFNVELLTYVWSDISFFLTELIHLGSLIVACLWVHFYCLFLTSW